MKKYVRCEFGHYYDSSKYDSCPHCFARSAGMGEEYTLAKAPLDSKKQIGVQDEFGEPIQAPRRRVVPEHTALVQPAVPSAQKKEEPLQADVSRPQEPLENEDPVTVARLEKETGINPPVGWLVEVAGPHKGTSFEIHAERNTIGRSSAMDICLKGDVGVSRDTNGVLSYNPRARDFHLMPGEGKAILYLNGQELLGPSELQPYDRIEISDTALIFVPLCGAQFCWEEME